MGGGFAFCCTPPTLGLEELVRFNPRAALVLLPVVRLMIGVFALDDVVSRALLDDIEKVAVA